MAQSTVDMQKMKTAAAELEKIYSSMQTQLKKLDENMATLKGVWTGEAAATYLNSYRQNQADIQNLATAIRAASQTLTTISTTYNKADAQAAEIIKQKMARG